MKIFLLGDSFTDNLFKEQYIKIEESKRESHKIRLVLNNPIGNYVIKLQSINAPKALWFDDWLKEWGYEVYNFGKTSCSIEDIIYQFTNLKNYEFEYGDRIILNWTHPNRFNWINDDLKCRFIHPNTSGLKDLLKELFNYQAVNREMSFLNGGYLNKNLLPFMEYIVELHSKYKPIIWTPFADLDKKILNQKYYFSFQSHFGQEHFLSKLPKNWTMREETDGLINDGHWGRYGNYYLAILFHTIIENNVECNYNENTFIFETALKRIQSENMVFPKVGYNII